MQDEKEDGRVEKFHKNEMVEIKKKRKQWIILENQSNINEIEGHPDTTELAPMPKPFPI